MSELSRKRLLSSLKIRLGELPHWLAWNLHPNARQNREHVRRFAGIHNGKRCFIVANGPSLRSTNLDFLANETTFGLNRIYLYFSETAFRPTYYVTMNELILEQFSADINKLAVPKFLNWNRRAFFEKEGRDIVYLKSKMVINDFFQSDLTKPLVVGATVTFAALQIAYYMGFQEVVLVGLDHDYAEKGVPSGLETRTAEQDLSHFHPQYFPKGVRWQLPDLLRSEIDFALARKAFEADGRRIYDATINGKCQVFEKRDYSTFFSK
ncbi:MAG: DUF115 domain-containing protein [Chloroflexi bacterium]|nr:DUF115 domain-containing protein [Chloroflexota bacterium]